MIHVENVVELSEQHACRALAYDQFTIVLDRNVIAYNESNAYP